MSFQDRIASGEFDCNYNLPSLPKKPQHLSRKVTLADWLKSAEVEDFIQAKQDLEAYDKALCDYKKALSEASDHEEEYLQRFKEEALDDLGLLGHPKAENIWSLAYERGHSSGYSEIYNELIDLADLF